MTIQIIETSALPDPNEINFESLSRRYRPMAICGIWLFALMFIVVMTITRWQPMISIHPELLAAYPLALGLVVLLAIVASAYLFIAIPYKKYCLTEHNLHYSCGVIFRKVFSQPILRVQHVELKRGPLERAFNLASLQVFSAGGTMHTFEIPGLSKVDAQRIRQFVLDHKDVHTDG